MKYIFKLKVFLLFFFVSIAIRFVIPQIVNAETTSKGTLIQIGDSLTVGLHEAGIESKYQAAGWTPIIPGNPSGKVAGDYCSGADAGYPCHAVSGGNSPTGIEAVEINKSAIQTASAIVIQLGTNRLEGNDTDAFKNAMTQMISKIKAINPSIKIYWVNLATMVNVDAYNTRNTIINEVMQANGGTVINWHDKVFASGAPTSSYFGGDGIHLTSQGYTAMVEAVTSGVGSASSALSNFNGTEGPTSANACWITKVGKPSSPPPPLPADCSETSTSGGTRPTVRDKNGGVCPVSGTITCGPSKPEYTNYGGSCETGHCGPEYCAYNGAIACGTVDKNGSDGYCVSSPATAYASDIASPAGTEVKIPTLYIPDTKQNHDLSCSSEGPANPNTICQYNCQDTVTNSRVWIQFHHSEPSSCLAKGTMIKTGDRAAVIMSDGNHTHVQIGIGGECGAGGSSACVPADKYLPCN